MRVLIAPDSFKESLSAREVAQALAAGVRDAAPDADIVCVPMADGGEGSLDAVLEASGGERKTATVKDANGRDCQADWAWLGDGRAFIEMATAAGLAQVPVDQRDVLKATSFGVGQLVSQALDAGARHITLGLGGSACNDGGAGLLQALGLGLSDDKGQELRLGGAPLSCLANIDIGTLDPRLPETVFEIAMDVNNPLCGPLGASAIFGPQKGATDVQVAQLDAALARFAAVCADTLGKDEQNTPGVGAAGGLGFAIKTFFNATFRPGVELLAELSGLPEAMAGTDLVFTGEGRMDAQTLHGKTPAGVARYAQARGIPVIAIVGSLGDGYQELYKAGITAAFSLTPGPVTLAQACGDAALYLRQRAGDSTRIWLAGRGRNDDS